MKALRILLVAAMAMMMVSGAFAQEFTMGGRADYDVEFSSTEVGDADADTNIKLGDGGRVQFIGTASKELDNGATVEASGTLHLETGGPAVDSTKIKYMNGPLTVTMLKADRPSFMSKGPDFYVPQDPLYNGEWVAEKGVSFEYDNGEGMKFVNTLNWENFDKAVTKTAMLIDDETKEEIGTVEAAVTTYNMNRIGVHPYVEMGMGAATVKAGIEYVSEFQQNTDADGPTTSNFGGGVGVYATLGAIDVGVSGGYAVKGGKDAAGKDIDATNQMSMYAYMKMAAGAGTFGVAGGYDMESIDNVDDDYTGYQFNVSYEQGDVIVPGLSLAVGGGYAFNESHKKVETTKTGGKVRLRYEF